MPAPKVYTDDQVLKTVAERRGAIRESTKTIPIQTIQELLRVKQQSQTTINVSTTPAGGAPPTPLPTLTDLTAPVSDFKFGLPAERTLRKQIALDQEITGYDLLYLGDNDLLDKDRQAILLRLDLSVNNFTRVTSFWGDPQFVLVGFSVQATSGSNAFSADKIGVYALQPEYTSIVSQESLLSSRMESYTAQALTPYQGGTITGGGSYQRGLEEGLLSLIETPVQYSIYTNTPNQFAFAFGPRRRINKRTWINPQRIFGDTYDIQYELEPGPRTVYAVIALPPEATELQVVAHVHQELVSRGDVIQTEKALDPVHTVLTTLENTQNRGTPTHRTTTSCASKDIPHCFTIPLLKTSTVPTTPEVMPTTVHTGFASHLFLTDTAPVTSETEVFIGSLPIEKSNVTVLGRYRLKVSLAYTKEQDDLVKSTQCGTMSSLPVLLVTPDRDIRKLGTVTLSCPPSQR